MSRRTRKPRTPPGPSIVPSGDIGRWRVCHSDGSYSEPLTLTEAREQIRISELARK